jgi:hypothetical protein
MLLGLSLLLTLCAMAFGWLTQVISSALHFSALGFWPCVFAFIGSELVALGLGIV